MVAEVRANRAAFTGAMVALVVGIVLVLVPPLFHLGDILTADPFKARTTTTVVVKVDSTGKSTTTTTAEAPRSLLEEGLSTGGLVLLRLGIVALGAFLAGAFVQRILMSNFEIELPFLKLPKVERAAKATEAALGELESRIKDQDDHIQSLIDIARGATDVLNQHEKRIKALKG